MAHVFKLNADGSLSGGTYTFGSTEVPVGETMAFTGSIAERASAPWNGKNVLVIESWNHYGQISALDPTIDLAAFRALLVFNPTTIAENHPAFVFDAPGDGGFRINKTSGDLVVTAEWNEGNSAATVNLGSYPSVPTVVEVTADLTDATAANRLQAKTWALGASVPGSWTTASGWGAAADGTNRDAWASLNIGDTGGAGNTGYEVGWLVISDDPDEDLSALLSSSATLTTPTATSITQTTATIGCTSDTAEGLVHAGVTTTATPPSDAQLIAGSGGGIVAAGSVSAVAGANTVGLTGLTADTGYFRHFIQSDGAGTATSTMLSPDETAGFTTLDNVPTITSVTPSTVAASTNPVIAGTNFGATQAGGSVIISPTDDSSDVNAVTQTVSAWADDEITLDGVSFPTGAVHEGTLYLFVFNNDQEVNAAGETIAAYIAPLLTNPTQVNVGSTTVTPRVTTTVGNGTAYHVIFPQSDPDPNKEQIAAGNGADDQPAPFSDSMAVSAAGELTFPEVTGLDPAVAYRIGYTHNGDPNA